MVNGMTTKIDALLDIEAMFDMSLDEVVTCLDTLGKSYLIKNNMVISGTSFLTIEPQLKKPIFYFKADKDGKVTKLTPLRMYSNVYKDEQEAMEFIDCLQGE